MHAFPLTSSVLDALFFSQPSDYDSVSWARLLGLVHLYSMTGIHLYAFLQMIEWNARWLGKFFGIRASVVVRASVALAFAVWVLLWVLQDFRLGMLKPLMLVSLRTLGRTAGVRLGRFAPLLVAVGIASLLSTRGNLIYFLAVAGGVLGGSHLRMAVFSWLAVVPLDLWEHRSVALLTPIMSLLSIPLVTGVMIPARLCEWAGAEMGGIWSLTEKSLGLLFQCGEWTGNLWACPLWASGIGFGIAAALAYRRPKSIWVPLSAILLLLPCRLWPQSQEAHVIQLNVGQGDAALVKTGGHSGVLIDTGPPRAFGRSGWLQVFLKYGVTHLRGVLLTHGDSDHAGGFPSVHRVIRDAGDFPFPVWTACGGTAGNAVMNGVVIPLKSGVYVNLGDSNARQERRFIPFLREHFRHSPCAILKVSHHGSRTSSSPELLNLCRSAEAWISAGRWNSYGHPHPSVVRRLRAFGFNVRSTAESGNLESP